MFAGCHTKVHKDHFDKHEEFLAYCKGKLPTFSLHQKMFMIPTLVSQIGLRKMSPRMQEIVAVSLDFLGSYAPRHPLKL